MTKTAKVGDYVAVKRCALATLPHAADYRGTVESIEADFLAHVRLDRPREMAGQIYRVNIHNLCSTRSIAFIK